MYFYSLKSGCLDVRKLLELKIKVGLGTGTCTALHRMTTVHFKVDVVFSIIILMYDKLLISLREQF